MRRLSPLLVGVSVIALAACDPASIDKEVGYQVDSNAQFGNATMNNTLLMQGELSYTIALGERFAAEVPSTVTFEFNRSDLSPEAIAALNRQADWIRQFPEVRFRVYGHTDLVGSDAYNKSLGLRRARAVVAYLASRGISTSRLEAVVSYGETRPVIATPNPEERNRRTVTEVTGWVKRHPTVLNGKYAEVIFREYVTSAEPRQTQVAEQTTAVANVEQ